MCPREMLWCVLLLLLALCWISSSGTLLRELISVQVVRHLSEGRAQWQEPELAVQDPCIRRAEDREAVVEAEAKEEEPAPELRIRVERQQVVAMLEAKLVLILYPLSPPIALEKGEPLVFLIPKTVAGIV